MSAGPGPGPAGLPTLRAMLEDGRLHVVDGAMGTLLYSRGVFVNVCYDALALEEPEMVRGIHEEYVAAGAEILETNTFGANPVKLSSFGLDERTEEINLAAARLAREAAAGRARVLGAVGPLGVRIEPWGPTSVEEARHHFLRQMNALLDGGADGLLLETFADVHEMEVALTAAREAAEGRPVFAQMTVAEDGRTPYGTAGVEALRRLAELGADAVGLNCSVGPAELLEVLEEAAEVVEVPLVAQPNAGLPRTIRDRKMYMASPEYMARYARRFVDAGIRFVGGCCGTTPEHVSHIHRVVQGLQPRHTHVQVRERRERAGEPGTAPLPLAERSALGRALAEGRFATTVELAPPRGWDATAMVAAARKAGARGVTAVSVLDAPRGRSRMAALPASTLILGEGVEPVMHYTCRDRNMMGMLSDLLGAAAAGVRNLLLVSGDPPVQGPYPDATAVFDIDSIGLTNLAAGLNRGLDPGGTGIGGPTPFVIGVALNPGAVDRDRELSRFRWKVDAGADFAVTQPVFDVDVLARFLDDARPHEVPVLVGVWPFTSVRNAEYLAHEVPGVTVPDPVMRRIHDAETRGAGAVRTEGIALAREVLARVRRVPGVGGVYVNSPDGDMDTALAVLEDALP